MSEPPSLPLANVAVDPAWGRPPEGPAEVADEHALLRLALWLADVAAEAALAPTRPEAGPTLGLDTLPLPGGAEQPPAAEPTS